MTTTPHDDDSRPVVVTSTRVLRGMNWRSKLDTAGAELQEQVEQLIQARGLTVTGTREVVTEIAHSGTWARLTCTATGFAEGIDSTGRPG